MTGVRQVSDLFPTFAGQSQEPFQCVTVYGAFHLHLPLLGTMRRVIVLVSEKKRSGGEERLWTPGTIGPLMHAVLVT